jgi:ribonucleoside-diphosphate reductase beta chain
MPAEVISPTPDVSSSASSLPSSTSASPPPPPPPPPPVVVGVSIEQEYADWKARIGKWNTESVSTPADKDRDSKQEEPLALKQDVKSQLSEEIKSTVPEPIRYVLFPILDKSAWKRYKQHQATEWTAEEIDFGEDARGWKTLKAHEQDFIKYVLAFFAHSDGIVAENCVVHFYHAWKSPEVRSFYGVQIKMEHVHAETYSLMIDAAIPNEKEQAALFNTVEHFPAVTEKMEWAKRWLSSKRANLVERTIAFAVIEGVFFAGSFCAIYWLRQRNVSIPGLQVANEMIARDETLHCEFAVDRVNELNSILRIPDTATRRAKWKAAVTSPYPETDAPVSVSTVHQIFREGVAIECKFIRDALPVALIGINADLMQQYIQTTADSWLVDLGYPPLYKVGNPFPWMETLILRNKSNFFEKRVTEYNKSGVLSPGSAEDDLKNGFPSDDEEDI